MKRYKLNNGCVMLECKPLNWRIEKTYYDDYKGHNPEFYIINVGGMSDMYQCTLIPETMILSITKTAYSSNTVIRFKVDSIEEASRVVERFAIGMGMMDDLENTIYKGNKIK